MRKIDASIKQKSIVSKEEWREWTKTVWHIANTKDTDHPAVFPVEIPHRLIKLSQIASERCKSTIAFTQCTLRLVSSSQPSAKTISLSRNSRKLSISIRAMPGP